MKLRGDNRIELSYSNAKALVKVYEARQRGETTIDPVLYRHIDGSLVSVSIVSDEDHYTEYELKERRSPYLPPEAWAGNLA